MPVYVFKVSHEVFIKATSEAFARRLVEREPMAAEVMGADCSHGAFHLVSCNPKVGRTVRKAKKLPEVK